MKLLSWIESHFGTFLVLSIVGGLLVPQFSSELLPYLKYFPMAILFLVSLKIDAQDVFAHITDYKRFLLTLFLHLVLFPLVFYGLFYAFLDPLILLGILLLVGTPAGTSTPFLTDLCKGNTSLSLALVVGKSLLAPFTIPFLFWLTGGIAINLHPLEMFQSLALMLIVPFVLAQVVKHFWGRLVKKSMPAFSGIGVLLLAGIVYASVGSYQPEILQYDLLKMGKELVLLYFIFLLLHLSGYFLVPYKNTQERIATSISMTYMNDALTLVIALQFLPLPEIIIFIVLVNLPWITLIPVFKKVLEKYNPSLS